MRKMERNAARRVSKVLDGEEEVQDGAVWLLEGQSEVVQWLTSG